MKDTGIYTLKLIFKLIPRRHNPKYNLTCACSFKVAARMHTSLTEPEVFHPDNT